MQLSAYRGRGQGPGPGERCAPAGAEVSQNIRPEGRSFPRPPAPDSKIPSAACIFEILAEVRAWWS